MGGAREEIWADLMRRANRGDRAAYRRLLTEVTPVIRHIVRERAPLGENDWEDVVQETLLALHTKRHTWREDRPFSPWLYAIARYKAADLWRRRDRGHAPLDETQHESDTDHAGQVVASHDAGRLMGQLDGRAQQIVQSIGIEERSARETGEVLGMSETAVRVAYHRALHRLAKLVGR